MGRSLVVLARRARMVKIGHLRAAGSGKTWTLYERKESTIKCEVEDLKSTFSDCKHSYG